MTPDNRRLLPAVRLTVLACVLALAACSSDDDGDTRGDGEQGGETPGGEGDFGVPPDGLRLLSDGSTRSVSEAIGEIEMAIVGNTAASVVAIIDHAAGARSVGEALAPTQVILFGNPTLGTPLMLASRSAGLDLPQRILAYENADGELDIGWNSPAWLAARHGIDSATPELATIAGTLQMLAGRAVGMTSEGDETTDEVSPRVAVGDGIVTLVSENDFETTYAALVTAIQDAGPLNLVVELDHAANAASAGLELAPTRLVVFGNPVLGTPLMQSVPSVAIDLPQRMLVWEADGMVSIAYDDPAWIAERHGITDRAEQVQTIADALAGLAGRAAGDGGN